MRALIHREPTSRGHVNPSEPSKTPLVGSPFGSLPLSCPETSHHQGNLKDIDHKFAVIDNKTLITGSFNWSPSAAHTNDETLLVIHSPRLAKHFTREMNRLWRGAELGVTARMQRSSSDASSAAVGSRGAEMARELASLPHSGPSLIHAQPVSTKPK